MKKLALILLTLAAKTAFAVPVVDTAVGTSTPYYVTVLPDDTDKNLYYFFPFQYSLSDNGKFKNLSCAGNPQGTRGGFSAYCSLSFTAAFHPDLQKKLAEIKAANPQARFTVIPFAKSTVVALGSTVTHLKSAKCQEFAGPVGTQVACQWLVLPGRYDIVRKALLANGPVLVMAINATYYAMVGKNEQMIPLTIPMYAQNLENGNYFFDGRMNPLK